MEELNMAKIVYVDVSRTAINGKRKQKLHYVYDGQKVIKVRRLMKLRNADEIYIDSLFPEIYNEILELLKKGVKVYILKDLRVLKKLRLQNNLRKSDEVDAQLLSMIPRDGFKLLTINEIEFKMKMRPLINKYEKIVRWRATLKKLLSQGFDYGFKESIRLMQNDANHISREIIREVAHNNIYREACRLLGVRDSVEVAILTVELPLHLHMRRLKGLLGFTPNRNEGRYYHRLRRHITALAVNLYVNAKKNVNISDTIIEIADRLPRERAIYRIQLMILKSLRIAYLLTTNPAGR
jgi:hypothetical protein